jgi:hypothetical protein
MVTARSSPRRLAPRFSLAAAATVLAFACAHGEQGDLGPAGSGGGGTGLGSSTTSPNFGEGGSFVDLDGTSGAVGGPCTGNGWNCKIDPCEGGPKTTVTAKVYDPAGKVPLYNVAVYVPNDDLSPIATGPSCDNCATPVSGSPLVSTLTDSSGKFVLSDVPVGTNVPLVMQIGKWRRAITLSQVNACQDNPFDDPTLFRLPRTQSEGNLPKIAIAVGGADTLECLLRRIGIADAEFTNPSGTGRVNLFVDDIYGTASVNTPTSSYTNGGTFPPFSSLFTGVNAVDDGGFIDAGTDPLSSYDIVMTSCQGSQSAGRAITSADKQALKTFVDSGGRAFLSHYNYAWLRGGEVNGSKSIVASDEGAAIDLQTKYTKTPFPPIAVWEDPTALTYAPGGDGTYSVDTSFPRGNDMANWLVNVGASTTLGQIALVNVVNPATSVISGVAQRWIYDTTKGTPYISANTPIELAATPDQQCGRVVHTGIHVAAAANDSHSSFPGGCETAGLTGQEKALEFLFFDMSSCVTDETKPPPPPPR